MDKWVREGCGGCDRRDGGVAVGSCSVLQGDRATRQQKWRNIASFLGVMGECVQYGSVWRRVERWKCCTDVWKRKYSVSVFTVGVV